MTEFCRRHSCFIECECDFCVSHLLASNVNIAKGLLQGRCGVYRSIRGTNFSLSHAPSILPTLRRITTFISSRHNIWTLNIIYITISCTLIHMEERNQPAPRRGYKDLFSPLYHFSCYYSCLRHSYDRKYQNDYH